MKQYEEDRTGGKGGEILPKGAMKEISSGEGDKIGTSM